MSTYTYTATLVVVECCECHMDFGVTPTFERDRRRDHRSFYCPVGHRQHYPQRSDVEQLRDELASTKTRLLRERDAHQHTEARRRAEKAAKTKIKKRVAAGVCPCCNRSFENLARHMASKHPDFAEKE